MALGEDPGRRGQQGPAQDPSTSLGVWDKGQSRDVTSRQPTGSWDPDASPIATAQPRGPPPS